ncbi:hypothetical protein Fmac_010004 [Flemingia macrophylla]|uniref:Uncharacterized protein n=1 Tax=Flemingia macrophylla TaxID=520843 RepID=A0ABD1N1U2_9FABA
MKDLVENGKGKRDLLANNKEFIYFNKKKEKGRVSLFLRSSLLLMLFFSQTLEESSQRDSGGTQE